MDGFLFGTGVALGRSRCGSMVASGRVISGVILHAAESCLEQELVSWRQQPEQLLDSAVGCRIYRDQ
jgi:hypothetical protein